jgi:hypothetical protein
MFEEATFEFELGSPLLAASRSAKISEQQQQTTKQSIAAGSQQNKAFFLTSYSVVLVGSKYRDITFMKSIIIITITGNKLQTICSLIALLAPTTNYHCNLLNDGQS